VLALTVPVAVAFSWRLATPEYERVVDRVAVVFVSATHPDASVSMLYVFAGRRFVFTPTGHPLLLRARHVAA
jgi:hypothetical protein